MEHGNKKRSVDYTNQLQMKSASNAGKKHAAQNSFIRDSDLAIAELLNSLPNSPPSSKGRRKNRGEEHLRTSIGSGRSQGGRNKDDNFNI